MIHKTKRTSIRFGVFSQTLNLFDEMEKARKRLVRRAGRTPIVWFEDELLPDFEHLAAKFSPFVTVTNFELRMP